MENEIAEAIADSFQSPNVCDSNLEMANVVDVLHSIAIAGRSISRAITPTDAAAGHDAAGGTVCSLTEAVMGMTAALIRVAESIGSVADAIRDHDPQ